MSSTGRKADPIRKFFTTIPNNDSDVKSARVHCNICKKDMVSLVARMKKHIQKYHSNREGDSDSEDLDLNATSDVQVLEEESTEPSIESNLLGEASASSTARGLAPVNPVMGVKAKKRARTSDLDGYIIHTSKAQKRALDIQVGRYLYATNSPFHNSQHKEFITLMTMARPGYTPPNRHIVGGEILDTVYSEVQGNVKEALSEKDVCMAIDGWSNVHNEPIVSASVTNVSDGLAYMVDSVHTSSERHTAGFLKNLAAAAIRNCESKYGCRIRSFVTDNASNMTKMREELAQSEALCGRDIISYGCSAHIANLLSHDLEIPEVGENIKQIVKYFRNTHFASGKYKEAGGSALKLPSEVRWNSLADCLESYMTNWHILSKVCSENRTGIDPNISSKIFNVGLKINAESFLNRMKVISCALDIFQRNSCTLSEATNTWIRLIEQLEELEMPSEMMRKARDRFDMAVTVQHLLAYLLDPKYIGAKLNETQVDEVLEYVNRYHPNAMADVVNYQAKAGAFKAYLFGDNVAKKVHPLNWWLSLSARLNMDTLELVKQLYTAVASTAGLERLFSTYGMVHSETRNRLGTEKAAKLVTVFRCLNDKISK